MMLEKNHENSARRNHQKSETLKQFIGANFLPVHNAKESRLNKHAHNQNNDRGSYRKNQRDSEQNNA